MIEELYGRYHPELVKWCRTMTGSHPTAEELVQEAFLRAMLNKELLASMNEKQVRAWLYRTVKNLYIDRIRHTSRETIMEEFPESPNISQEMTAVEWEDLLRMLSDMERLLFIMRYLEGYTSKQIGEMFALPPGTVRSKLSSARKHLREAMGGK